MRFFASHSDEPDIFLTGIFLADHEYDQQFGAWPNDGHGKEIVCTMASVATYFVSFSANRRHSGHMLFNRTHPKSSRLRLPAFCNAGVNFLVMLRSMAMTPLVIRAGRSDIIPVA